MASKYTNRETVFCPYCDYEYPQNTISQNAVIMCGNCGKQFDIQVIRTPTGKRVAEPEQSIAHDEFKITYTCSQLIETGTYDLTTIKNYDEAVNLYYQHKINIGQLQELVQEREWENDITGFLDGWNGKFLGIDRNPHNPDGDNKSREHGPTFNPYFHPKGRILQGHVKLIARKTIDCCYGACVAVFGRDKEKTNLLKKWLLKKVLATVPGTIDYISKTMVTRYDKDAFVFDDPFLLALRELGQYHINKYFQWDHITADPLLKITDLSLNLLKEDIAYRPLFKQAINDLIQKYPDGFELTEAETKHIKRIEAKNAKRLGEKRCE